MIDRISDLRLFKRIVELGSMTAAAHELGLSTATISNRLAALEQSMSTQLINRTTRKQKITSSGSRLFELANRVLAEVDDFADEVSCTERGVSGSLRVSAPLDLGHTHIAPAVECFLNENPSLRISLWLTDDVVDLTEKGVDIAIRYGRLQDSSLRLRRIATNRRIPVASPDYLARMGEPRTPWELESHNCMVLSNEGNCFDQWSFTINDLQQSVRVSGDRDSSDAELLRHWAVAGKGIALKSAWDVVDDVINGRLTPLLVDYCPKSVDLQLLLPSGSHMTHRVRAFSDFLVNWLKEVDRSLNKAKGLKS
ncbi:LysR family transcriptional regulator [Motiliproteus sp. MSK22-1]|uniref:LysR family transcriptional regulator n=1 Tax=Motiliproteus sp. MSK22-1 TaxID=1897630 RepID=UPI000975F5EA|nr:LysR family transcriptional regulator [Motiliproteus sp. MSK22-1]OMH38927.1 hypothetical protein BGP75_00715 [Motiliproteus sp. MSK22-1]